MPRAEGRYMLHGADCTGDYPIRSSDDLEDLLHDRDVKMDQRRNTRRSTYFVTDREDPERGTADWCQECPTGRWRGTFSDECDDCAKVAA
jgi:hypothetical protein